MAHNKYSIAQYTIAKNSVGY